MMKMTEEQKQKVGTVTKQVMKGACVTVGVGIGLGILAAVAGLKVVEGAGKLASKGLDKIKLGEEEQK